MYHMYHRGPVGPLALLTLVAALTLLAGCPQHPPGTESSEIASEPPSQAAQLSQPERPSDAPTAPVSDLTSLELEFADGTKKTVEGWKGKVLVLDFWATFCEPCTKKLPKLQKLQAELGEDKVAIIAVALDPDVGTAKAWAKANKITLPVARFTDAIKKAFFPGQETIAIPQVRVLNGEGKLAKSWGPEGTVEELAAELKKMTSG
ncbi:MAG: TlpA family protein disulfide reductase [Armatimonadota bacterium]